jgi:hypothetical protein
MTVPEEFENCAIFPVLGVVLITVRTFAAAEGVDVRARLAAFMEPV